MSTFLQDLLKLCLARCEAVQADPAASAQTVEAMADVTSSVIAAVAHSSGRDADVIARYVAGELPGRVARGSEALRQAAARRANARPPQ